MSEYSKHIVHRVATFIEQNHLLDANVHTLYVGLSGGPDSVALLHILHTLLTNQASSPICHPSSLIPHHQSPITHPSSSITHHQSPITNHQSLIPHPSSSLTTLHCNFHLRGEESNRDQHFCEQLCHHLGIRIIVKEFDTFAYMQSQHLSLEMAARQLRYDWWQTLQAPQTPQPPQPPQTPQSPQSLIALGHHQDDSIETLLMNLMRGTGLQGLTGIVPYNAETHVIRPLLCLSRQEILDYLSDNHLDYVQDSTNAENDTLRNQIRNQLLPLMEQILPQARLGLGTTMLNLQSEAKLNDEGLASYVAQQVSRHSVDGYTYYVVPAHCPYTFQLERYFLRLGYHLEGCVATPIGQSLPEAPLPDSTLCETFDADTLTLPLRWRRWQQADRMAPLGMNGHTKLLSDLFSNAHYLPIQKQLAWVLVDASGEILWVPGLRMSHSARVTQATTRTVTIPYGPLL